MTPSTRSASRLYSLLTHYLLTTCSLLTPPLPLRFLLITYHSASPYFVIFIFIPPPIPTISPKSHHLPHLPIMSPTMATRRLACMLPRLRAASQASFHTSRPAWVNVGDHIPDLTVLVENSPGNKVNLSQELGNGLIIGVPAAFSTSEVSHFLFLRFSLRCPFPTSIPPPLPPQSVCIVLPQFTWHGTQPPDKSRFCVPQTQFIPPPPLFPPGAFPLLDFAVLVLNLLDTTGPGAVDSLCLIACFACCDCCDCCNWYQGSIGLPSRFDMTQVHRFDFLNAGCRVLGAWCWVLGARC